MSLKTRNSEEVTRNLIPKKKFKAYKFVRVSGDQLMSPHYHYIWSEGNQFADLTPKGNGDAGFYLTYFKPGIVTRDKTERRLTVWVDPKDVLVSGTDGYSDYDGICFVVRACEVKKKDYENALVAHGLRERVEKHVKKVQSIAKKTKVAVKSANNKLSSNKTKKSIAKLNKDTKKKQESEDKKLAKAVKKSLKKLNKRK